MNHSRRKFLASVSAVTLSASTAGCTDRLTGHISDRPPEEEFAELEDRIEELEEREETLETQLEEETTNLEQKLEDEQTTVTELQERLDEKKSETETLRDKLDEKDTANSELQSDLTTLENEVATLERLLGETHDFSDEVLEKAYEVGDAVRESVFEVEGGTGFHIGNGHIVTNAHVIDDSSDEGHIRHYNKPNQKYTGLDYSTRDEHGFDPDIGLLYSEVDENIAPALEFGDPRDVDEGQPLIAVGHPANTGKYIISLGRHKGFHSGYRQDFKYNQHQSSIPAASGISGSPVLTLDGKVIAVQHSTVNKSTNDVPERVHTTLDWGSGTTNGTTSIIIQDHIDEWTQ